MGGTNGGRPAGFAYQRAETYDAAEAWASRPKQDGGKSMQASLNGIVLADSPEIAEAGGYSYFPRTAVRMDLLEISPKTDEDLKCPHGVQFYDIVLNGERHPRNAWSYEAPQPRMAHVDHMMGFWEDVAVG